MKRPSPLFRDSSAATTPCPVNEQELARCVRSGVQSNAENQQIAELTYCTRMRHQPTLNLQWLLLGCGGRGIKPMLDAWDWRHRNSAISAITVSPQAGRVNLHFDLSAANHNVLAPQAVAYLRQLRGRYAKVSRRFDRIAQNRTNLLRQSSQPQDFNHAARQERPAIWPERQTPDTVGMALVAA